MMKIEPFALERYFALHEFSARWLLSSSDCESLSMSDLLAMADSECLELWENLKFGYTETFGHPALREAMADPYPNLTADHILVAAPEEGIFLTMQALLTPGDHVICTFPGYQSLHALARSIGCEVSFWKFDDSSGWHLDIKGLEQLIRDDTKMVVINFPHNPTGYTPIPEDYEAIVQITGQRGVYLFSDEMYRFLEHDGHPQLPSACELYDRAVSLGGLSKAFGLPGLRMGWLAAQDLEVLTQVSHLKDYTTICNSAPSEILGLIAMRNRSEIVARQKARIHKNIKYLENFMARYQDHFVWNQPMAGSICFPRMTICEDTFSFCRKLVEKAGIMLVPGELFGYGRRHIRIGYGRDDFPEVLGYFAEFLDSYPLNQ